MLANYLTLGRIALVLPFCITLYIDSGLTRSLAAILFLTAAVTDFLDGYVARRFNQASALGAALDPVADKLLTGATLLMLIYTRDIEGIHLFAALIILLREILVTGLRESVAGLPPLSEDLKGGDMAVTPLAKWKTTSQFVAFFILILDMPIFNGPGLAFLWLATLLTVITGRGYVEIAFKRLKSARKES